MISRGQISEVMAGINTSLFPTVEQRNRARREAVTSFLEKEKTVDNWINGSEADMILSDLPSYKEWDT